MNQIGKCLDNNRPTPYPKCKDFLDIVKYHRKECQNESLSCPFSQIDCVEHSEHFDGEFEKLGKNHSNIYKHLILALEEMKSLKSEMITLKQVLERKESSANYPSIENSSLKISDLKLIYIWKIEEFSKLKKRAERSGEKWIISDPFYTKDFGYKMCLIIYPAGNGMGDGTNLSVFISLMKGEYDDLLSWPFQQGITLTLIDYVHKTTDHSCSLKPDPRSVCFQKPKNESNMSTGYPTFISIDKVLGHYISNDTIYLKVQVEN